ncbi:MAG: glyceraldehyde-3-phosphate dehydrogenase [Pseudomonadales bacterium]
MTQNRPVPSDYFQDWKAREALAEGMIPLVGKMYRENNVSCYIYGRALVNKSVIDIMKAHRFVRQIEHNELSEFDTFPIISMLAKLDLSYSHIDVGRLAVGFMNDDSGATLEEYVQSHLDDSLNSTKKPIDGSRDVVLYGFGRIGRLMARLLIEKTGGGDVLRLKAVVVRPGGEGDLIKRASLLRRDSVHGGFKGTIRVDEENNRLICNGNPIQFIYANAPDDIDYNSYGIDNAILVDNTGKWRDEAGLGLHLKSKGISQVLLTAPGKGDIKNIVYGINHEAIQPSDTIVSAASCTTNAITPVLSVMMDEYGVENGHVETVHAFTNDQNLIDNFHSAERRGRAAPLNMVLTETGAAKAVAKALPELAGKLTGNAIRVPTPNVSMAILNLTLEKETTKEELNEFMRRISLHSSLRKQIDFTESPDVVSSDFVGSRTACIFDAKATIVNGRHAVLYCWYDNEFGYSCQVQRIVERLAGVKYDIIPRQD